VSDDPSARADRAVYFDCDGTLVDHDRPYGELVREAARRGGVPDDARAAFADAYGPAFFAAFEAFDPAPIRTGAERALDEAGADADAPAVADAIRTLEVEATVARPGAATALTAAAEAGPIGVLTDGLVDLQRRKLAAVGLFDALDAYVPSYEVGAHKPAERIFETARRRLPAVAHVHVGVDAEIDVAGARAAGFRAIHVGADGETDLEAVAASLRP